MTFEELSIIRECINAKARMKEEHYRLVRNNCSDALESGNVSREEAKRLEATRDRAYDEWQKYERVLRSFDSTEWKW